MPKSKKPLPKSKPKQAQTPPVVVKRPPPPPPPRKVPPPPPPPRPRTVESTIPPASVLHQLPKGTTPATHIQYTRPPTYRSGVMVDAGVTIVIPINCMGDFSSFTTGRVQYGKLRYGDTFVAIDQNGADFTDPPPSIKPAASTEGATEADLPARIVRPTAKREGVCAFIDARIMEGGRSAANILELVMANFPGRDPKATLSTIKTRPSHIKAKGQVPPPFLP